MSFSDYPFESEMLFVGGFFEISIIGLYSLEDYQKYDDWLLSMKLFQYAFRGRPSEKPITDRNKKQIELLMDNYMENQDIPLYIRQLFRNSLNKVDVVKIDMDVLTKDIWRIYEDGNKHYGYKSMSHYFLNDQNIINWSIIGELFKSLDGIEIHKINNVTEKYAPSMLIDDKWMDSLFTFLSNLNHVTLDTIVVYFPIYNKDINKILDKYGASFKAIQWQIRSKEFKHPKYGTCDSLWIEKGNK